MRSAIVGDLVSAAGAARPAAEEDTGRRALTVRRSSNCCEACVDVCPTEVLDLVDHKVRVARFSDCVQCEQCAIVCPALALVM